MGGVHGSAPEEQRLERSNRERQLVAERPKNSPDESDRERQRLEELERRWNSPNEQNRRRQADEGVWTLAPVVPPPPARPIDTQLWIMVKDQRIARAICRQWRGLAGEEICICIYDKLWWAAWFENTADREAKGAIKRRQFDNNGWHESVDHHPG